MAIILIMNLFKCTHLITDTNFNLNTVEASYNEYDGAVFLCSLVKQFIYNLMNTVGYILKS